MVLTLSEYLLVGIVWLLASTYIVVFWLLRHPSHFGSDKKHFNLLNLLKWKSSKLLTFWIPMSLVNSCTFEDVGWIFWGIVKRVWATFAAPAFVGFILQLVIGPGMGAKQTFMMALFISWWGCLGDSYVDHDQMRMMILMMLMVDATCDWKSAQNKASKSAATFGWGLGIILKGNTDNKLLKDLLRNICENFFIKISGSIASAE